MFPRFLDKHVRRKFIARSYRILTGYIIFDGEISKKQFCIKERTYSKYFDLTLFHVTERQNIELFSKSMASKTVIDFI